MLPLFEHQTSVKNRLYTYNTVNHCTNHCSSPIPSFLCQTSGSDMQVCSASHIQILTLDFFGCEIT